MMEYQRKEGTCVSDRDCVLQLCRSLDLIERPETSDVFIGEYKVLSNCIVMRPDMLEIYYYFDETDTFSEIITTEGV